MALLSFPGPPLANGQLYPTSPLTGQNQYSWSASEQTWRLEGPATGVVPGTYGDANHVGQFTVDAQGRITFAQDVLIPDSGTVTQIDTGTGLTGGPITTSGTIALDTTYMNNTYLTLTGGQMTGNIVFVSGQVINGGSF